MANISDEWGGSSTATIGLTEQEKADLRRRMLEFQAKQPAAVPASAPVPNQLPNPWPTLPGVSPPQSPMEWTDRTASSVPSPLVSSVSRFNEILKLEPVARVIEPIAQKAMRGLDIATAGQFGKESFKKFGDPEQIKNQKLTEQLGEEYDAYIRSNGINERDPSTQERRTAIANAFTEKYKKMGWQPSSAIEATAEDRYNKLGFGQQVMYRLPADIMMAIAAPAVPALAKAANFPERVQQIARGVEQVYGVTSSERGSFDLPTPKGKAGKAAKPITLGEVAPKRPRSSPGKMTEAGTARGITGNKGIAAAIEEAAAHISTVSRAEDLDSTIRTLEQTLGNRSLPYNGGAKAGPYQGYTTQQLNAMLDMYTANRNVLAEMATEVPSVGSVQTGLPGVGPEAAQTNMLGEFGTTVEARGARQPLIDAERIKAQQAARPLPGQTTFAQAGEAAQGAGKLRTDLLPEGWTIKVVESGPGRPLAEVNWANKEIWAQSSEIASNPAAINHEISHILTQPKLSASGYREFNAAAKQAGILTDADLTSGLGSERVSELLADYLNGRPVPRKATPFIEQWFPEAAQAVKPADALPPSAAVSPSKPPVAGAGGGALQSPAPTGGGTIPPIEPPKAAIPEPAPKPGFAGNIRLSKFDESLHEDLLKATENPAFVEARRRGTRGHATTLEAAQGIANQTGGDVKKIEKALGQAYNAEEAKAIDGMIAQANTELIRLRNLVKSVDGDTTLNRLNLVTEQNKLAHLVGLGVSARAEAGRALESYKILNKALRSNDEQLMRKVLQQSSGADKLADFLKKADGIDWTNPVAVNNLVRSLNTPKWWNYVHEIYINSILSGIKTHVVNSLTTGIYTMKEPLDTLSAGLLDAPWSVVTGKRTYYPGEAWAEVKAMRGAYADGLRAGVKTLRDGIPPNAIAKMEFRPSAFSGKTGRVINFPVNAMEAEDQVFYAVNYEMAIRKLAYRQGKASGLKGTKFVSDVAEMAANPTPEMVSKAQDITVDRLFRRQAGKTTQALMSARDSNPVGKFLLPFVRTPVNLLKVGLESSPLGIFNPKLIKNIATKNPEAAEQLAKVALGSMFAGGLYLYAKEGLITGAAPTNLAERDRFYREGKQPYSLKVGNDWISFQRLEPFNQTFTQVAALAEAVNSGNKDPAQTAGQVTTSMAKNLVSQTYLSGLSDIMDALAEPERYAAGLFDRLAVALAVPFSSATRTVAQAFDKTVRQPRNISESLQASIPGLSQNVAPKLNAFGEPVQRTTPFFSPINFSPEQVSLLNATLSEHKMNIGFVGDAIKGIALNREEQTAYQMHSGQLVKERLLALVESPEFAAMPKMDQEEKLDSVAAKAKTDARNQYIMSGVLSEPRPGDTPKVKLQREDLARFAEYLTYLEPVTDDDARSTIGKVIRFYDPGLDVALALNGNNSGKVMEFSDKAQALLAERKAGGITTLPPRMTEAKVKSLIAMIEPYYLADDKAWVAVGQDTYNVYKEILRLERMGTDYGDQQATKLKIMYPKVVITLKAIQAEHAKMRSTNPVLDEYVVQFGG